MRAIAPLLLLLAACHAPAAKEEAFAPSPEPEPVPAAAGSPALDDAQWRVEAKRIVFERHLELAARYRDAMEVEEALAHVDQALALDPSSEKAKKLRTELQRMIGQRAGEVSTMIEDEWLARQAREEERVLEAQRALAEARAAEEAGDLERAANLYKRAAYLAREE